MPSAITPSGFVRTLLSEVGYTREWLRNGEVGLPHIWNAHNTHTPCTPRSFALRIAGQAEALSNDLGLVLDFRAMSSPKVKPVDHHYCHFNG